MYVHIAVYLVCLSIDLATGYIDVWEHFRGGRHIDADWRSIFEDLYNPKLDFMDILAFTIGNPLGCRGSACVKVMTILHGSPPSLQRRAKGCLSRRSDRGCPSLAMVVVPTSEDAHARMDRLEQRMRQLRVSDGGMV
ncbi:hypothetical protein AAG906_006888 [Vitis piasezkii]